MLSPDHAGQKHRDAEGQSWRGWCEGCGRITGVSVVAVANEFGTRHRELCVQCAPTRGCALCGRPVDPADPRRGLCPGCVAAAQPTREGLEQAVVIVAAQVLAESETVDVGAAHPETLAYQIGALRRALRSVLHLLDAEGAKR